MGALKLGGAFHNSLPVWVSPEKTQLMHGITRPQLRPLSLVPPHTICGFFEQNALRAE